MQDILSYAAEGVALFTAVYALIGFGLSVRAVHQRSAPPQPAPIPHPAHQLRVAKPVAPQSAASNIAPALSSSVSIPAAKTTPPDLYSLGIRELRRLAKERQLKGFMKLSKTQLIPLLESPPLAS